MDSIQKTEEQSSLKSPYVYSSLAILVVALYVGYVLLSRHESSRQLEKQVSAKQLESRREADRRTIDQLGGSELSIRGLYVSPEVVGLGEAAQLCYDVANAKMVTLDPPVAEVWPSHSRCIDLKIKKTTTYTLTITDAAGKTISQSVELKFH